MEGMVLLPGGEFSMGSDAFYPEERPVRRAAVDAFLVELRAGRRLARATVTTDPARTVTLRLRPRRRAAARRVVVIVRYGDAALRLAVRL
jgi:hypothetical protein